MGRIETLPYPSKGLLLFKILFLLCFLFVIFHNNTPDDQPTPTQYISYRSTPLFTTTQMPKTPNDSPKTDPEKPPSPSKPDRPEIPSQPDKPTKPEDSKHPGRPTQPDEPTKTDTPQQPDNPQQPSQPEEPKVSIPNIEKPKNLGPRQKTEPFGKAKAVDRDGPTAFLEQGGVIRRKDPREVLICKLNVNRRCYSKYIAEHVELMWAFCPIYSTDQHKNPTLYHHHKNFLAYMKSFGITTQVLEAIYPGQQFQVTRPGNEPWEIQLTVNDSFYYRENFLNVAIRKTKGYEYIIWIDAHQMFLNLYWWEEAILKMEHHASVQFYQNLAHLTDWRNETIPWLDLAGVQYAYKITKDIRKWIYAGKGMWNGNAVGIRKEIYEKIDHIIDECIAGCCDCAFNYANMVDYWDRMDIYPGYGDQLMPWIEMARKTMGGNVDVVRGVMYHLGHEHYFDWGMYFKAFGDKFYNLTTELYRDENYTLHVKDGSPLLEMFPKVH